MTLPVSVSLPDTLSVTILRLGNSSKNYYIRSIANLVPRGDRLRPKKDVISKSR